MAAGWQRRQPTPVSTPAPDRRPPANPSLWDRIRRLPLWLQVVLWVLAWPLLGAAALLAPARRSPGRLVAAVVLLAAVSPAWAAFWLLPDAGEPRAEADPAAPIADPTDPDDASDTVADGPVDGDAAEGLADGDGATAGTAGAGATGETGTAPPEHGSDRTDTAPGSEGTADTDGRTTTGDTSAPGSGSGAAAVSGTLEVHVLDVGQADATLLRHDEVTVLIDTGHWQRRDVVTALEARGVDALDLVIVTHPHADHLGQFPEVLDTFAVAEVWWSPTTTTTQVFERSLDALERSDAAYEEPRAGDRAELGPLLIDVVNPPPGLQTTDVHDAGLAVVVTFGSTSMLFTGDAEAATEARMVGTAGARLDVDVLQLGHHGSSTSTTPRFLAAASPQIAVYSAGRGNQYGHPHTEVVDRLRTAGIRVYGTDVHGDVLLVSDGRRWTVTPSRAGEVTGADRTPAPRPAPPPATADERPGDAPTEADGGSCGPGQIDLNRADVATLSGIVHLGPARAEQVVALRPFRRVEELTRVSGIGPARIADILAEGIACVD